MDDLPLLELFTRLREAGLPLGIPDYEAAVQALQKGYGLPDRAALARLCRMLWVRSSDEQQLFDYYFEQLIGSFSKSISDELESLASPSRTLDAAESLPPLSLKTFKSSRLEPLQNEQAQVRQSKQQLKLPVILIGIAATGIVLVAGTLFQSANQSDKKIPALVVPTTSETIPSQELTPTQSTQFSNSQNRTIASNRINNNNTPWIDKIPPIFALVLIVFYLSVLSALSAITLGAILSTCFLAIWIISKIWTIVKTLHSRSILAFSKFISLMQTLQHRVSKYPLFNLSSEYFKPALPVEVIQKMADEIQAAQTVQQITAGSGRDGLAARFILSTDYLPVTKRQMKQSWRHLRRMVREGLAAELDVEATVQRIACDGMLLNPVLMPRRTNRTELVLLIDQDGSMVPFHLLSARLVETALRGGRLGKAGVYYFHNCPVEYLYNDPMHQEAEPIEDVLRGFQRDRTAVLIFSDAGAARGGLSLERAELTAAFLQQLKQHVRYVAWLNPMPKPRWNTSTARDIAVHVPMFEATRQGLDEAIDALRGRHHALAAPLGGQK